MAIEVFNRYEKKYNEKYNSDDQDSKEYERYSGVIAITVNSGETNSYTFDNIEDRILKPVSEAKRIAS